MLAFVVPGLLTAISGGSLYDRHMVEGLRGAGRDVRVIEAAGTFPAPDQADRAALDAALASLPDGTPTVVDGLVFGGIPELAARHGTRLRLVSLVHLPLAADPSASPDEARARGASERDALRHAAHVIVTGARTVERLAGSGVPPGRVTLIEPGTAAPTPDALAAAARRRGAHAAPVRLLTVATVNPIKGHARLLDALAAIDAPWHLTCAGSLTASPATVRALRARIAARGWNDHVTLTGALAGAALDAAYADADVFVLPTRMETYGMAVAEALAWHLPVVATDTGAIASLVGADAGLIVPVDDHATLTAALERVLTDAALRRRLAEGAARAATRLPAWHDQVSRLARLLDTL